MSISVTGVSKVYGQQKALNEVSFSIKSGEIVGFLGPNGAGKSTMMKILTCYIPQSKGVATVCGLDVSTDSIAVRKKVGYLPEHNPLYLEMYVKEYLHFMGGIHGKVSSERIEEMIQQVGLTPERHKKLGQLSKGYRQRAGLAAALLHDPEVLILDEPTTGLDPNQLVEIRNLIKSLGKAKTVMLSTHIMQEVEMLCSRVIIINKGEIVADQAVEALKTLDDSKNFTVEFDLETSAQALRKVPGINRVQDLGNKRWLLTCKANEDIRTAIFQFAVQHQMVVLELKQQEQSLEQYFQKLTDKKAK
jgi:ABC-2 type transport system ATP-binding protein